MSSSRKPQVPPTNKLFVKRRETLPSECRERHATYRGKLTARLEYRVNEGDWKEMVREAGNLPIMLRVRPQLCIGRRHDANRTGSRISAILRPCRPHN